MIAVYAGSFDPVSLGHRSVAERAAALFEQVVCLVAVHPSKQPLFSADERVRLIEETMRGVANVRAAWYSGYTVEFARSIGARYLIRGVRDANDAGYELELAAANRKLAPEIATLFIPADRELSKVSSSELKRLVAEGADVSALCHPAVQRALSDVLLTESTQIVGR